MYVSPTTHSSMQMQRHWRHLLQPLKSYKMAVWPQLRPLYVNLLLIPCHSDDHSLMDTDY